MSVPDYIIDKDLYRKAREEVRKIYKKPSAYASMQINKIYRDNGGRYKKNKKKSNNLTVWKKERWVNLSGYALGLIDSIEECPPCGQKFEGQGDIPSICRPTVKVNKNTPDLAQSYSRDQMLKALLLKSDGWYIEWSKL